MKLLTKELERSLPPLKKGDGIARAKFFTPWTYWTWYVLEANAVLPDGSEVPLTAPEAKNKKDVVFFGLVHGLESELGYFSLRELEGVRGPVGLRIERDMYFKPTPLDECKNPVR